MTKVVENTACSRSSERCLNLNNDSTLIRSDSIGLQKSLDDASLSQTESPIEMLSVADENSLERDLDNAEMGNPLIEVAELPEEVQHVKQIALQQKISRFKRSDGNPELPRSFKVGQASGNGDCFFDSIAKCLTQLKPGIKFTVKSLRKICKDLAVGNQQLKSKIVKDAKNRYDQTIIIPDNSISDDELWGAYLASIEYTGDDINKMQDDNPSLYQSLTSLKYGSTLQSPIWGRPDIEGQIICREYNIKLHIIEKSAMTTKWLHQIVDKEKSKSVEDVDYNDVNTVHMINKGDAHFEPILSTQETQYSTSHSESSDVESLSLNLSNEKQVPSHAENSGKESHEISSRSRKRACSVVRKDDSASKRLYANSESFSRSKEANESLTGNNKRLKRKSDSGNNSHTAQSKKAKSDKKVKNIEKNFFVELIKEFELEKNKDYMEITTKKLVKDIFPYYENSCLTRFLLGQFLLKNLECTQVLKKHLLLYPDNEDITFLLILQNKAIFLNIIKNARKELESRSKVPKDLLPKTSFLIDLSHSLTIDMIEKEGDSTERFLISIRSHNNIKEVSEFNSISIDKEVISANSLIKSITEKTNKSIKKITDKLTSIIYQINFTRIFQNNETKFSLIRNEIDFKTVVQGLLMNDKFTVLESSASNDTRADLIVQSSNKKDALLVIKLEFNTGETLREAELQLKQYINDLKQKYKTEKIKGLVLSYNENEKGQGEEKKKITYKCFFHSNNEIDKISLSDTLIASGNRVNTPLDLNSSNYPHASVLLQREQGKEIYINFLEKEGYVCIPPTIAKGKPKAFNRVTIKNKSKEKSVKIVGHYGCSDLHLAIAEKSLDRVKELINIAKNKEEYIITKNNYGDTSLHFAAQMGSFDIIKELVNGVTDKERYVKDRNNHDHTSLHFATQSGNLQVIKKLISCIENDKDKEEYVKTEDKDGLTPLHYAVQSGNLQVVEELISFVKDKKSYIATKNYHGDTPLHYAAYNGYKGIVEKLMSYIEENKKEYITARNEYFNTPLHLAVYSGHGDIFRMLLDYIEEDREEYVTAKNKFLNTFLHLGSYNGNPEVLSELVDCVETDKGKEEYITAVNRRDYTPFHYASKSGVLENIEKLIIHVTDKERYITSVNKCGYTPLHFLAQGGNLEVIEGLMSYIKEDEDKEKYVKARNKLGYTALHYAAYSGHKNVVEVLLNFGANVNAKGKNNLIPLHLAAYGGHVDVVEVLLNFGANVNAKNKNGLTPLDLAKKNGKSDVVDYIEKNWIDVDAENKNGKASTLTQADANDEEPNATEGSSNERNNLDTFQSFVLSRDSAELSDVDNGNSSVDINSEKSASKGLNNVQSNGGKILSSSSSASEGSTGQESDFEQDNATERQLEQSSGSKQQNSSWKSSSGESDSRSSSSSFQEEKQPTLNDINKESFGDEEDVYSSPEQNSDNSLEREEGSCLPILNLHDLGDNK